MLSFPYLQFIRLRHFELKQNLQNDDNLQIRFIYSLHLTTLHTWATSSIIFVETLTDIAARAQLTCTETLQVKGFRATQEQEVSFCRSISLPQTQTSDFKQEH